MSFLFSSAEENHTKISPVKTNIKEANEHIRALCERVSSLESERDELSLHYQQKLLELHTLQGSLGQSQEQTSHREIRIKNLELTTTSQEEIIVELEAQIVAYQRDVQAKADALRTLDLLVTEKESVYERLCAKVGDYQKILAAKDQVIQDLTIRLQESELEKEHLKRLESAAQDQLLRGQKKVEKMESTYHKEQEEKEKLRQSLKHILTFSSSIENLVGTLKIARDLNSSEKSCSQVIENSSDGIGTTVCNGHVSESSKEDLNEENEAEETHCENESQSVKEDLNTVSETEKPTKPSLRKSEDRIASILLFNGSSPGDDSIEGLTVNEHEDVHYQENLASKVNEESHSENDLKPNEFFV